MKKKNNIGIGSVLIYHTCKGYNGIGKDSTPIEPYDKHYLVKDIRKEGFYLHNLDKGKFYKVMSRGELNYLLNNKKMEIAKELA